MARKLEGDRLRNATWRTAGQWMVGLALVLALLGIVLAFKQVRSQAFRLLAQSELRAVEIVRNAREIFLHELETGLARVAAETRSASGGEWHPQRPLPPWIDGLYLWENHKLRSLIPPLNPPPKFETILRTRLAVRSLGQTPNMLDRPVQLLYDNVGTRAIVIACYTDYAGTPLPRLIAGRIHLGRLKDTLIEPLLPSDGALELVPASEAQGPWTQPMTSALRFWSIRPTPAFVDEQKRTALVQTAPYLALTLLALVTLLVTIYFLIRVVRREVLLADLKANFVADVSHELKTPLAVITMYAETLQSGRITSEEKKQEYYTIMTRESVRLSNLINNILDFSRIEANRKGYTLQPTNVATVVANAYEAFRVQLDDLKFEHHLVIEDALPLIDADADAVSQILFNLIGNAIKYSEDDRYVAIEVTSDTRRNRYGVLISVHDRGIGVQPEDRAHLLEGFFRAKDVRVRQKGGAGLGLALVKHIVDGHHGSIDVEPRLVKGSTFRVFLPATENAKPATKTDIGKAANEMDEA